MAFAPALVDVRCALDEAGFLWAPAEEEPVAEAAEAPAAEEVAEAPAVPAKEEVEAPPVMPFHAMPYHGMAWHGTSGHTTLRHATSCHVPSGKNGCGSLTAFAMRQQA